MNNFTDFFEIYPKYKKFSSSEIAETIYTNILSTKENIHKMLILSRQEKPALAACITQIEYIYEEQVYFSLKDKFAKQCLGAMVKVVLEPFGYKPFKRKDIPKGLSKFISTASVYRLDKNEMPKLKIVQKISIEVVE